MRPVLYKLFYKLSRTEQRREGVAAYLCSMSSKVAVYAPAERADTLTLFLIYPYIYSVLPFMQKRRLKVAAPPCPILK